MIREAVLLASRDSDSLAVDFWSEQPIVDEDPDCAEGTYFDGESTTYQAVARDMASLFDLAAGTCRGLRIVVEDAE